MEPDGSSRKAAEHGRVLRELRKLADDERHELAVVVLRDGEVGDVDAEVPEHPGVLHHRGQLAALRYSGRTGALRPGVYSVGRAGR